jgi:hypothetical protein
LLANDWANFVRQLAQSASGEEAADQSLAWKFIGFVAESDTLTKAIDVILRKRDSVCGGGSASTWKGVVIEQYDPRDLVVFPRETLIDIFSDGYVLQFIADLVALTHDADRAASFYTEITDKKFLDTAIDAKPAELNFYFRRATSKYRANWYPRDAADDFDHAFKLDNEILDAIAASNMKNKDAMKSYYESLRAAILNNKIYNLVSDWLEGRPLDADKITTLEEAANELRKWVGAQSMTEILDPHMQGRFYSTTLVSAASDTLATYEIVVGETKRDRSKERCARVNAYLTRSQEIWDNLLRPRMGDTAYREATRTREAHRAIYRSICAK